MLGNSTTVPEVCNGVTPGSQNEMTIYIGTYPSESSLDNDLNPYLTGTYAEDNNGSEVVVFVSLPIASPAMLEPLETYGCTIHQLRNPTMAPPATQPPRANTNTMPAPTALPPPSDSGRQSPPDADRQGFLGYPGARCNYTNSAVVIGRAASSALVICETGVGRFYYRGVDLQNGAVEIEDPAPTGSGVIATNNGVHYSVSPGAITQGSSMLSNKPMLE